MATSSPELASWVVANVGAEQAGAMVYNLVEQWRDPDSLEVWTSTLPEELRQLASEVPR